MAYNYIFTEKAAGDLDEIIKYIREDLSNPTAAKQFYEKVFDLIDKVREFPETGMIVDNEYIADREIHRLLIDNYIMYYKAEETGKRIVIVRIIYGKRNLAEILKKV